MKALIIEDESAAVRRLAKLIKEVDPSIEVENDLDSIESALDWFGANPLPDLIFLDIHLADGSSFEIFNHVEVPRPVIFTTAYDEYAIQAFRLNAIDYLLKPIKRQELERAIEKYRKWKSPPAFDYKKLARTIDRDEYNKRFLIRLGQNIRVVEIHDCAYFYTQDKITFLVNREGKRYPLDYSLERLEEMADPRTFFRINRQFIVNINAIKEMYAYSKSRVKIELSPPCELEVVVSTERSPHFKKWLTGES
jgi:two-component system LytT family response regulator